MIAGKLKQIAKNHDISKWFRKDNLIIMVLTGILLLVIALPSGEEKEEGTGDEPVLDMTGENFNSSATKETENSQSTAESEPSSLLRYEEELEKKLCRILEGMYGAGAVEVMITFTSTGELVVEKDRPVNRSNTTENDSEGGNRTIYETESGETTVYQSSQDGSEPYVVKTLMPKVEGVLVAAQGAGSGEVKKQITEAVQALFDLEAHKIKVIRMKE